MKTQEELRAIREDYESLTKKLGELTDDEMEQVVGGMKIVVIKSSQKPLSTSGINGFVNVDVPEQAAPNAVGFIDSDDYIEKETYK